MVNDEALRAWTNKFILIMLSIMGVMVIVYLGVISFYPIPADNTRIVDTTQGFLMGTVLNAVISIFTQFLLPKNKEEDENEKKDN